ncbi:Vacuolar protein sorting-associated protein 62 [Taxawa tesnikishii (nom. ined.)]|nr:Vacuolar protein sorting-associated protein 62 [Dothideales sp. JES 119]
MSPFWTSGTEDPNEWSEEERGLREIPQYVLDYAPYVHLFSGEHFWPCDIAEHLVHTSPHLNYTLIESMRDDRTLDNLDELNQYGRYVYLQSDDNVEERPGWLGGSKNIPETPGDSNDENSADWPPTPPLIDHLVPESLKKGDTDTPPAEHSGGGHSTAPAVLVVIPKADGIVDAFWFYFYSYNLGNQVLNVRFGNHVGDWEHTVVRFQGGEPISVYLSEHNFGTAYTYFAMEKYGKRPVTYSATGTHAMYATPGLHPYVLPWGLLHDQTDRGPLWDPLLNAHSYTYNHTEGILRSSLLTPRAPTSWFYYRGHWGDKFYPLSDPRQYRFAGQYHYVSGPSGPRYKNLGRKDVCQGRGNVR